MGELTIDNTFGALEIGTFFAALLFGVVASQAYHYYSNFPNDKIVFKVLVAAIICLEIVHTGCAAYEVYNVTITLFGRADAETRFLGLAAMTFIGGMITMLCQLFFCARVWKVLPKPWNFIAAVCMLAALARGAGSIVLGSQAIQEENIMTYRERWKWLITFLLTIGAAIDVTIAASMLYFLLSKRRKGLHQVGKLIDRLVGYTIRTGLFTSVTAVALLIVFRIMPENLIWLAMYTCLAKLYSNSLLSALNERHSLRTTIISASTSRSQEGMTRRDQPTASRAIAIEMRTTTEMDIDIEDDAASSMHSQPNHSSKSFKPPGPPAHLSPTRPTYAFSSREREWGGLPDSPGGSSNYSPGAHSIRFEHPSRY